MSSTRRPLELTRRRMLAASGAGLLAPLTLAACGAQEDEGSDAEDVTLLNGVIAAQLATLEAAKQAEGPAGPLPDVVAEIVRTRTQSIEDLGALVEDAGGTPTDSPADPAPASESPAEALVAELEISIESALDRIGELQEAVDRRVVHRYITEDAAALAALRSAIGEDIAPDSFVFGPPAPGGDAG